MVPGEAVSDERAGEQVPAGRDYSNQHGVGEMAQVRKGPPGDCVILVFKNPWQPVDGDVAEILVCLQRRRNHVEEWIDENERNIKKKDVK